MHIFGIWEETRLPGETPCRHGEKVQTPQTLAVLDINYFFFVNVIMKQCWIDDAIWGPAVYDSIIFQTSV